MRLEIVQWMQPWRGMMAIDLGVTAAAIVGNATGAFQLLEWITMDKFFRLRPAETSDDRSGGRKVNPTLNQYHPQFDTLA